MKPVLPNIEAIAQATLRLTEDPLRQTTRNERKALLLSCAAVFLTAYTNLIPKALPLIGNSATEVDRSDIYLALKGAVIYFLIATAISLFSDIQAAIVVWREGRTIAQRQYENERDRLDGDIAVIERWLDNHPEMLEIPSIDRLKSAIESMEAYGESGKLRDQALNRFPPNESGRSGIQDAYSQLRSNVSGHVTQFRAERLEQQVVLDHLAMLGTRRAEIIFWLRVSWEVLAPAIAAAGSLYLLFRS